MLHIFETTVRAVNAMDAEKQAEGAVIAYALGRAFEILQMEATPEMVADSKVLHYKIDVKAMINDG